MFTLLSIGPNNFLSSATVALRLFKDLGYQNLIPNCLKYYFDIDYLLICCSNPLVT